MKLHTDPLSGNSHKVRLMLALIGKKYEEAAVDLAVFPYVMLTKDTTIKLSKYPKIESWVKRIETQDWYVPMPG